MLNKHSALISCSLQFFFLNLREGLTGCLCWPLHLSSPSLQVPGMIHLVPVVTLDEKPETKEVGTRWEEVGEGGGNVGECDWT